MLNFLFLVNWTKSSISEYTTKQRAVLSLNSRSLVPLIYPNQSVMKLLLPSDIKMENIYWCNILASISPNNIKHKCSVCSSMSVLIIFKKERKKERKNGRWDLGRFLLWSLKKGKIKIRKKERKKEKIMWFVACPIEREKKRKQTNCQVISRNSRLTWESEKERKKERKKERTNHVICS